MTPAATVHGLPRVSVQVLNDALDEIIDPCSISVGVPMGVREMGLVRRLEVGEDGVVEIDLRMTSPGCHMGALVFEPSIIDRLMQIPGVTDVRIDFLEPTGWSEADIEPGRRAQLVQLRLSRPAGG